MKKKNVIMPVVISIGASLLATGFVVLAKKMLLEKKEEPADVEDELTEQGEDDDEQDEAEEGDDAAEFDTSDYEPQEETLESYIAEHPEEEESLNAVKNSFTADGVTTDISCTGNTMFFDFIMSDVDDEDTGAALKPDLESFLEEQENAYAEIVSTIQEETGIEGIKMIVIFMDANENEIVSGHYDANGKVL